MSLVRVQPVHLQGTVADVWRPILERLQSRKPMLVSAEVPVISQAALLA